MQHLKKCFFFYYILFQLVIIFSQASYLNLPLYNDELVAYYVPAAKLVTNNFEALNLFNYKVSELYGHTPAYALFLALILKYTYPTLEVLRASSLMLSLLMLLLFFKFLSLHIKNTKINLLATLLLSFNISFYPYIQVLVPDIFFANFVLCYLILLFRNHKAQYLIAFILPWVRESALFLGVALVVYQLIKKRWNRDLLNHSSFYIIYSTLFYFLFLYIHKEPLVFLPQTNFELFFSEVLKNLISISTRIFLFSGVFLFSILFFFLNKKTITKLYIKRLLFIGLISITHILPISLLHHSTDRYYIVVSIFIYLYIAELLHESLKVLSWRLVTTVIFLYMSFAVYANFEEFNRGSHGIKHSQKAYQIVKSMNDQNMLDGALIQFKYHQILNATNELNYLHHYPLTFKKIPNVECINTFDLKKSKYKYTHMIFEKNDINFDWIKLNKYKLPLLDMKSLKTLKIDEQDFYLIKFINEATKQGVSL